MELTSDAVFVLTAPLANVPAGATGQLKHLDSYHVALLFDGDYEDLVFDKTDTEPSVWRSIERVKQRTAHPRYETVAALLMAFAFGWVLDPPTTMAKAAVYYVEKIIPL